MSQSAAWNMWTRIETEWLTFQLQPSVASLPPSCRYSVEVWNWGLSSVSPTTSTCHLPITVGIATSLNFDSDCWVSFCFPLSNSVCQDDVHLFIFVPCLHEVTTQRVSAYCVAWRRMNWSGLVLTSCSTASGGRWMELILGVQHGVSLHKYQTLQIQKLNSGRRWRSSCRETPATAFSSTSTSTAPWAHLLNSGEEHCFWLAHFHRCVRWLPPTSNRRI